MVCLGLWPITIVNRLNGLILTEPTTGKHSALQGSESPFNNLYFLISAANNIQSLVRKSSLEGAMAS